MLDLDALDPAGLAEARALCSTGRAAELFDRARGGSAECRGRVAVDDSGAVSGVALSGAVAGALGTAALLWVAVRHERRRRGVGRALVADALGEMARGGARLAVAEMPDGPDAVGAAAMLAGAGFEREGFVADFYRDGVGLTLWRRPLR